MAADLRAGSEAPLLREEWTLTIDLQSADVYTFSLVGSKTGPDGSGRSDQRFVSRSRRVVIEPGHWNLAYALKLAGTAPRPAQVIARFRVEPHFVDQVRGAPHDPAHERAVTVAQGLASGPHVLTLQARGGRAVAAVCACIARRSAQRQLLSQVRRIELCRTQVPLAERTSRTSGNCPSLRPRSWRDQRCVARRSNGAAPAADRDRRAMRARRSRRRPTSPPRARLHRPQGHEWTRCMTDEPPVLAALAPV